MDETTYALMGKQDAESKLASQTSSWLSVFCCASTQPMKLQYPLEQKLGELATINGIYVISIIACSRERVFGASPRPFDQTLGKSMPPERKNLIITFGSPPNAPINGPPLIAEAYFDHLKQIADQQTGVVALPGHLLNFKTVQGGKTVTTASQELLIGHRDWRIPLWKNVASYSRAVWLFIYGEDQYQKNTLFQHSLAEVGLIPPEASPISAQVDIIRLRNPKVSQL